MRSHSSPRSQSVGMSSKITKEIQNQHPIYALCLRLYCNSELFRDFGIIETSICEGRPSKQLDGDAGCDFVSVFPSLLSYGALRKFNFRSTHNL